MNFLRYFSAKTLLNLTHLGVEKNDADLGVTYAVQILSDTACCLVSFKRSAHNHNVLGLKKLVVASGVGVSVL